MTKQRVIGLSASPSAHSKTAAVLQGVLQQLEMRGICIGHIRLRELDPTAVLRADLNNSGIANFVNQVAEAHGIVVATPIYKAAYSGLLKASLDLLPQFAFSGKVVLPIATGGSLAHVLALDYALRPVLQSMAARHIVQSQFLCNSDLTTQTGESTISVAIPASDALGAAIRNFCYSLTDAEEARWLGHPRPSYPSGPNL